LPLSLLRGLLRGDTVLFLFGANALELAKGVIVAQGKRKTAKIRAKTDADSSARELRSRDYKAL
jgi:hypothetical protein